MEWDSPYLGGALCPGRGTQAQISRAMALQSSEESAALGRCALDRLASEL